MSGSASCLRADAQRNREKVMAAAQEVFAELGLDAPLEDVARRAGVGVGTLYRRFPTRQDLIACTFEAKMAAYAQAVDDALADPDPWHGFCAYIERVCGMQADDRGFNDVLTLAFPTQERFEHERARAYLGFVELIGRAKATGRLRADFVPEDLVTLLMAIAGVITATAGAAPGTWRRLVAYLLQAFALDGGPLPDPPEPPRHGPGATTAPAPHPTHHRRHPRRLIPVACEGRSAVDAVGAVGHMAISTRWRCAPPADHATGFRSTRQDRAGHRHPGQPYLMRAAFRLRRPRVSVRGRDLAGQVETVGSDVTRFRPGDEVYAETTTGSFAEYASVREDLLALKPTNLTFEQPAAVVAH